MFTTLQTIIIGVVLLTLIGGLFIYFFAPIKTFWLIVRVSPFEQTISGTPTVLILGDSTGYGTGATDGKDSIAGLIGSDFALSIKNQSDNGRTIDELLSDIKNFEGTYELILLQIGANDILQKRPVETVEDELRTIINKLSTHTQHIIMMPSGNVGASPKFSGTESETYEQLSRDFRDMFLQVANDTQLVYIDLFEPVEEDPFAQDPEKYIAIDGLHPSSAGYKKWYDTLYPAIAPILNPYKTPDNETKR